MTISEARLARINDLRQKAGKPPLSRDDITQYLPKDDTLSEEMVDKLLSSIELLLES